VWKSLMDEAQKKEIEEIIRHFECPKDFICYKSGFKVLCTAIDIPYKSYYACMEENARECKFAVPFGDTNFCECPLRVYIAKTFKK
jgi:hypothetical protein